MTAGYRATSKLSIVLFCALLWGCLSADRDIRRAEGPAKPLPGTVCAAQERVDLPPGINDEHLSLEYWLTLEGARHDIDFPLLQPDQIANLNASVGTAPLLGAPLDDEDRAELLHSIDERLRTMRERIRSGQYRNADGASLAGDELTAFDQSDAALHPSPRLHLAVDTIPLRCGPRSAGLYKLPQLDLAFDRNNCSSARPQEPIEVLGEWPNGMKLARTRYSLGWIEADAKLSPEVPAGFRKALSANSWLRATRYFQCTARERQGPTDIMAGTLLAPAGSGQVVFGSEQGVYTSLQLEQGALQSTARPITRRGVLEEAFTHLDEPYGWGGYQGGRDCSRLLMDIFGTFGLNLPRFSGNQALAGSFTIDISEVESDRDRLLLLDAAAQKGIVLLYLPGHIMLYLGRDEQGEPMALHSLSEFVEPCAADQAAVATAPDETLYRIDRVTVSDLNLGRGSSRRAFIERLTRLVVIGAAPGAELQGVAMRRAPAPIESPPAICSNDEEGASLTLSPEHPHKGQPLRAIATSAQDPGAAAITFFDPQGSAHSPPPRRFGGPPHALVAQIDLPPAGNWTVVFGEGENQLACRRLVVQEHPRTRAAESTIWGAVRTWNDDMEDLYAAFIESLFDYPLDKDITWPDLHSVLNDPQRNIFYNHLSANEEARIGLHPDCADLPYLLRAYFAWKMRLPFAFRHCDRGTSERAPICAPPQSNLLVADRPDPVRRFNHFAQWTLRDAVHSGAGRTAARDDQTDYYPLPMTRPAIRPGTVYADPYGHLLVVARWVPQGVKRQGKLIAVDAQPDGTIGLKRFWRGNFLFNPNFEVAGAGFKAFRPLVIEAANVVTLPNSALDEQGDYTPYSEAQYQGSHDDFYQRMEKLINPRPLDPQAVLISLVDALEEAVQFRRVSVDNGVNFSTQHPGPIAMPTGGAIFETVGPWENYSTPSRDMRLLIALDTVIGFPEQVVQQPRRFGLDPALVDVRDEVRMLRQLLAQELAARSFEYTRSDGQSQRLSLDDLSTRSQALEMAYNPNDCIELRWAAPDGSAEAASCQQRSPPDQQLRMEANRDWFATRQRPLR